MTAPQPGRTAPPRATKAPPPERTATPWATAAPQPERAALPRAPPAPRPACSAKPRARAVRRSADGSILIPTPLGTAVNGQPRRASAPAPSGPPPPLRVVSAPRSAKTPTPPRQIGRAHV